MIRPIGRWTSCSRRWRRSPRRSSPRWRTCSTSIWTSSSSTPPAPTSRSRAPTSSPTCKATPPMTSRPTRSGAAPRASGPARPTARICRRWFSRWRSPATGCRCGAGRSPATPPTPRSSAPSPTTWPGGTCAGASGWPPAAFASAANRAYLTRGGGHYIHAEKLRATNAEAAAALARPGRYHRVADNLRGKEVGVAPGGGDDGDGGVRTQRFVVCHYPAQAERDSAVRTNLVTHLQQLIEGSHGWAAPRRGEFVGSLKGKPGLRRHLRRTPAGLLRIDSGAIKAEAHLDGKWLLRTDDLTLTGEDLAAAYQQLTAVERGWRDMKGSLALRPVFHHREDRIRGHVQLCWLALLLIRVAENSTGQTWRTLHQELDRLHLVTLATGSGTVAQRSMLTSGQKAILTALDLPEPPRFFDFTPASA